MRREREELMKRASMEEKEEGGGEGWRRVVARGRRLEWEWEWRERHVICGVMVDKHRLKIR